MSWSRSQLMFPLCGWQIEGLRHPNCSHCLTLPDCKRSLNGSKYWSLCISKVQQEAPLHLPPHAAPLPPPPLTLLITLPVSYCFWGREGELWKQLTGAYQLVKQLLLYILCNRKDDRVHVSYLAYIFMFSFFAAINLQCYKLLVK
jgi:hypothetical protein